MSVIDLFLQANPWPRLSSEDRAALEGAFGAVTSFPTRHVLVHPRHPLHQCTLLLDGFIERYQLTREGRRQIVAIHVPGDFVDLHSYPLKRLEHHVAALTPVRVAPADHAAVRAITHSSTTLTELLWRSTLVDAAMNREWITSIGARPADVRIAHLLCEMYLRLGRVGMAGDNRYALPITQADMGDATGLTPVHTNRMLRRLREADLVTVRSGVVSFPDWNRLKRFAQFDDTYLFRDESPALPPTR